MFSTNPWGCPFPVAARDVFTVEVTSQGVCHSPDSPMGDTSPLRLVQGGWVLPKEMWLHPKCFLSRFILSKAPLAQMALSCRPWLAPSTASTCLRGLLKKPGLAGISTKSREPPHNHPAIMFFAFSVKEQLSRMRFNPQACSHCHLGRCLTPQGAPELLSHFCCSLGRPPSLVSTRFIESKNQNCQGLRGPQGSFSSNPPTVGRDSSH